MITEFRSNPALLKAITDVIFFLYVQQCRVRGKTSLAF